MCQNTQEAAVGVSITHEATICVVMAAVNVPHVQESVAVAHQVHNEAVPRCMHDQLLKLRSTYHHNARWYCTINVLKPVPYVHEEVGSYVEPEPNQSNYVYGLCAKAVTGGGGQGGTPPPPPWRIQGGGATPPPGSFGEKIFLI